MIPTLLLLAQIDIDPGDLDIPQTEATDSSIADILSLTFGILGAVAFIVIIIAGMRFVLTRGDAEKAAKARNTVIYAAVGLAVASLAFAVVRFIATNV